VLAGDNISSISTAEFLKRADNIGHNVKDNDLPSPLIPNAYNRIAEWHISQVTNSNVSLADNDSGKGDP
jgi:hypothetical protein